MSVVEDTNNVFATQQDLEGLIGAQAVTIMVLQKRLAAKDVVLVALEPKVENEEVK